MTKKTHINIFIVDDNRIFSFALRANIENAFQNENFKINLFETGEQCMEHFNRVKPELVILDYTLNSRSPDAADGLQVLDKIKINNFKTSVIMLTGNDQIDIALNSFHHGASDYVLKTESQFKMINESITKIFAIKKLEFISEEKGKRTKAELIHTKNQKEEVERSKFLVEEKNKSITDSINYAKRIQQAKLPRKEDIYASFPQSFILFKPKDIVSGDFYFFHKNDNSIFIVAADCTGHGVPGAFMSMIGSEKLDDAVAHSSDTSEILNHLNRGIKNSLHQTDSGESTRDGMDIAICSVDKDNHLVKYAGANRPLWIIRNGQRAVEEIKGTKKAIGGLTADDQHFDSHELKLEHGDTFYIATDGYADQFGGQEEKKLMTKKFKEILIEIQDKSMMEQEKHLDDFVENWKAGKEQVDDILVIGVRM